MSEPKALNPESTVIQQLAGHWDKMLMAVVMKLGGGKPVKITAEDLKRLHDEFDGYPYLFTHGMADGIEFSIVTAESARRLVEHDRTMREQGAGHQK